MGKIMTLGDLCEGFAPVFRAAGLRAPTAKEVVEMMQAEEAEEVARLQKGLKARENARRERKFLRDEKGHAYGHVVAEVPAKLYFQLMKDPRFGRKALESQEGLRDLVKAFPACRVKQTGSKYIGTGFGDGPRRAGRGRVVFGRGTLT